jgi:hypothetical protein
MKNRNVLRSFSFFVCDFFDFVGLFYPVKMQILPSARDIIKRGEVVCERS